MNSFSSGTNRTSEPVWDSGGEALVGSLIHISDLNDSATLLRRTKSQNADISVRRVQTPAGYILVVVKNVRAQTRAVSESLRKEYAALQEVNALLGNALYDSVPQPLLLLESEGAIVLSFVRGIPLSKILRRDANLLTGWLNINGSKRLHKVAVRVGEWLQTFHTATRGPDEGHDHGYYAFELERTIPRCEPFGLSPIVLAKVRDAALALSRSLSGYPLPIAAMHGDFVPQNILIQEDSPGVIDFASYGRKAPVYSDLAHFLAYTMILGRKPYYSRRVLQSFAGHFLRGYSSELNSEVLRLYLVKAVIRIVSDGTPGRLRLGRDSGRGNDELLLAISDFSQAFPI